MGDVATSPSRAPSPLLAQKLGGWWQGLVVLGSCWWQPQAGWWRQRARALWWGEGAERQTPGLVPGPPWAGAVLVGSNSCRHASLPWLREGLPAQAETASNLCLFLPHPPVAIPFCRVSNRAARGQV